MWFLLLHRLDKGLDIVELLLTRGSWLLCLCRILVVVWFGGRGFGCRLELRRELKLL